MSDAPQLTFLSTNRCPNAGLDYLFGNDCNDGALTTFGYCMYCWWHPDRIPAVWKSRVQAVWSRVFGDHLQEAV